MKKLFRFGLFVVQFAILGLAAAFVISIASPPFAERVRGWFGATPAPAPAIMVENTPTMTRVLPENSSEREIAVGEGPVSYAKAVAKAAPAVVSITASKVVNPRQQLLVPTNPILQRMFPGIVVETPRQHKQSLGSGVIVSADGYVVTNNHVIEGAEEIQVVLYDGRSMQARVVGKDAETDLAVLKIDGDNLPNGAVQASTPINVGDVVLAIGNPFGLNRTVTMGIVSALGRQFSTYEDFIQTDAAINQGNSGGALVNAYGELVGINSDMYSPKSGGNVGIGFAIPIGTAKAVLTQLVQHGHVIRGWLGAEYADISSLQNPGNAHGVAVIGVYPKGPAADAGLHPGDVLLEFNGEPVTNQLELRNREAALAPGTSVQLSGQHGSGESFNVQATLQERPQLQTAG